MSGYVPAWIQKGKPVLYRGKPHIVVRWFFTSGDGCPNIDELNLVLRGVKGAVQWSDYKPLHTSRHPIDTDILSMGHLRALREIMRLRGAIRKHRDAKGNARCWLNDTQLYRALPEKKSADSIVLSECTFLANCKRYYRRQKRGKA